MDSILDCLFLSAVCLSGACLSVGLCHLMLVCACPFFCLVLALCLCLVYASVFYVNFLSMFLNIEQWHRALDQDDLYNVILFWVFFFDGASILSELNE